MLGSDAILEILEKYTVDSVFGLIGETSFPLYGRWENHPDIRHLLARDERNSAIMADGYSRAGDRPGICEVPGVGASYTLPGIVEAYYSGTPMIVLSSDIALSHEKRNFLTEYDKSSMFSNVTKEYISVNRGGDIPRLLRRAFRVATTGRMGPVFIRFPMNTYEEEVSEREIYAQEVFGRYPSIRIMPDEDSILRALHYLGSSSMPVIIAGQGVLLSHAEEELETFSSLMRIPVGTTISGKGAISELGALSIGVVGSRGGTEFSNGIISSADLIFFIGTNADSASTSEWRNPPLFSRGRSIIHLDISEAELGNNYPTDLFLYGDAKLTLARLVKLAKQVKVNRRELADIARKKKQALELQKKLEEKTFRSVNPIKFVKALQELVPADSIITADPGTGAIYSSAYFKVGRPGRKFIFNYSVGGLGFSLPAAIGAYYARGGTALSLTTDGSFGFFEGELETMKRYNPDVKVIMVNNGSFGWIRATMLAHFGKIVGETDFAPVDYSKIAEAHGIPYGKIDRDGDIIERVKGMLKDTGPFFLEVLTEPEDQIIPPVPEWKSIVRRKRADYLG